MKKRAQIYRQMDPLAWDRLGLSGFNWTILILVLISVIVAIAQSERTIRDVIPANIFDGLTALFAVLFSVEYVVRLWAMGGNPIYDGVRGRLRYALTLSSVFDLAATLALWADLLVGVPGVYGVLLRLARVLRVITLTRQSALGVAIRLLVAAIMERKLELSLSFGLALVVLLISATVLFAVEGEAYPEDFGSIPRALWWAVATLTTVGYGDVSPHTALGQFAAGIVALTSIAIVAMPTGIMAAAFSDAFQLAREDTGTRRRE